MDAGAVPKLRAARGGFWRMPLPALLLAGDATTTDPACSLAPAHHIVESALAEANSSTAVSQPVSATSFTQLQQSAGELWIYRRNPE